MTPQKISSQAWADSPVSSVTIPSRLATTESDRLVYLMRDYGDMQIHCTVHFKGRINPERLARAVRLSMDTEPILGCYYQPRWWRSTWHRHDNIDELSLCTLEETEDLDTSLQAFLTEEFDPKKDPLIHARLLRKKTDVLCVKVSHVIADAGGVKQYIYLLSSLYNQLSGNPKLSVTPILSGSRSLWQVIRQLGWRNLSGSMKRSFIDLYHRFVPFRYWKMPAKKGSNTKRTFVFQHIEPEQFDAMKYYARQHNATINDLIVTAYLRAHAEVFDIADHAPVRTMNTVDLRRYMPGGVVDRTCNFSSFSFPIIAKNNTEAFAQTLVKMRDQMNLLKANLIGLTDLHMLGTAFSILPTSWGNRLAHLAYLILKIIVPPVITNMGRMDPLLLNFDECPIQRAYLTASVLYPPLFAAGCSGFGNQMTLSAGFCETSIDSQTIVDLFSQVIRELPS